MRSSTTAVGLVLATASGAGAPMLCSSAIWSSPSRPSPCLVLRAPLEIAQKLSLRWPSKIGCFVLFLEKEEEEEKKFSLQSYILRAFYKAMNPTEAGDIPDTGQNPPSVGRGKTDIAWGHVEEIVDPTNKKKRYKCLYCSKIYSGGGIHRMKAHLANRKGDVAGCKKVPPDIQFQMRVGLDELVLEKQKKQRIEIQMNPYPTPIEDDDVEVESIGKGGSSQAQKGKGKGLVSYFAPRTGPGAQPTIKSKLAGEEAINAAHAAVGKWIYDACIPFNAIKSKYFQPMLDAVAAIGGGYKAPSYHDIRSKFLKKNVNEVKEFVASYKEHWKEFGCTIMADGWSDMKQRTLINFLVYSPKGIVFLKSVDATEHSKTAELLFYLFKEVVIDVGVENIVQIITDNASNYVAAARLLTRDYPTIYWSPCAAHCIDLMLEDIGKKEPVKSTVESAREMTRYIYNHGLCLKLMRKYTKGKEIIRPAATRFATNFLTLQSILRNKEGLRLLVACGEWTNSKLYKTTKGLEITELILTTSFWTTCSQICKFTEPLVRLLRIVDSDEKPAMGYVYEGMLRVREAVKTAFNNKRDDYMAWLKIIDDRWDRQLHRPLHAAGYWLNPQFFYDRGVFSTHHEIFSSVLDCVERFYSTEDNLVDIHNKINMEIKAYREALGDFGRSMAINARNSLLPADWWINYGGQTPYLQKMAIRILSQTASSSGCERNWSVFERIHTKKRNRMEHQRLNDLVYVHYNLRLTQRNSKLNSFDPISLENISMVGDWVVENDLVGEAEEDVEDWHAIDLNQTPISDLHQEQENDQGRFVGPSEQQNENDDVFDLNYSD